MTIDVNVSSIIMTTAAMGGFIIGLIKLKRDVNKELAIRLNDKSDTRYVDRELDFIKRENENQHNYIIEVSKKEHELTRQSLTSMEKSFNDFSDKMAQLIKAQQESIQATIETHEIRYHKK